MPAPSFLAGLPKPILFALYGAIGGLLGAVVFGEPAWWLLKPPEATPPPQLAIGASSSVKLYPGTKNTFVVRIARERFDSPVAIKFGNLPSGIALPSLTVPPGETQIDATVTVDASVPTGTSKVTFDADAESGTLTASGTIDIEVIAPPPALALAVPPSLAVFVGGTGKFTASVARRSYSGEIAVAINDLPAGVTVARAAIPPGGSDVEVTLSAAPTTEIRTTKLTVTAITDSAGLKTDAPTQLEVKKPPIAPVDIVFVLDVTASMQWALGDLKNGIGKFADALSKSQINFRLGLVTFQDITNPGEKVEVIQFDGSPFTANPTTFRDKVGQLKAEGGGDIPESSLEGVAEAIKLPFRQGATKILLLITDAPPKVVPESDKAEAVQNVVAQVKAQGIDSVHLVVERFDIDTYKPLLGAGAAKGGGKSFDLGDVVRGDTGFDEIFSTFGRVVTEAAMAKSSDIKPQIAAAPDPPKVPGGVEALKGAEAPPPPSIKGVQASGQFAAGTEGRLTLAIGVWTGAIAAMLCLALLSGQHHYLRGQFPSVIRAVAGFVGGFLVGIVGGAAGQGLYMLSPISVFQILGWALLGGLAGSGLSLFIPNLKWFYGLVGGAIGGAVGGLGYMNVTPLVGDVIGRLVGGLIVGLCIGLMVAIVEAAFRRAWLEVRYGARETITVNLGPEPVKVGGDAKMCTVWARGAAPLALRFFIRDGQVICDDTVMKRESSVAEGFAKEVGNVTVTVRTGSSAASSPPSPARIPSPPPPKATPGTAAKAPMMDDDFDALPMAMSPPPAPSKPAAPAVPVGGSRPISPPVPASPPAPAASKPQAPPPAPVIPRPAPPIPAASKPALPSAPPKPPTPPAPGSAKPAVPMAPPVAPKAASPPPASPPPTATPKHPDSCPSCGRVNAGKPKARYCMVCDLTY
jgi:hypothetical protein